MKRFSIIFGLVSTITLIIVMVSFLVLALVYSNKYKPTDSLVFIESVGGEFINEGMGFVYKTENQNNYIVTNYHVIESSNFLYMRNLKGKRKRAVLVWHDKYTDIAILKIEDELGLKNVKIGSPNVDINDKVYYFNINNKEIENGIITSLDNEIKVNASYGNSLYKANSIIGNIVEGNSGSPVLNNEDEVIGMISLKEENQNKTYYLPIEYVMDIVSKLENQSLYRANLGATFINTTNTDLLSEYGIIPGEIDGVVVLNVREEYPLDLSGMIDGDIITKVNDTMISDVNILQKEIYSYGMNETITIEYCRNDAINTTNVVLSK